MSQEAAQTADKIDSSASLAEVVGLGHMLDKSMTQVAHLDAQINILVGIDSAVFIFSADKLNSSHSAGFAALVLLSAISLIVALVAVHPYKFIRKMGTKSYRSPSLIKNSQIISRTIDQFVSDLSASIKDRQTTIEDYAGQIYCSAIFYYRPKRKLFNLSRSLLLAGVMISASLFLYHHFK